LRCNPGFGSGADELSSLAFSFRPECAQDGITAARMRQRIVHDAFGCSSRPRLQIRFKHLIHHRSLNPILS